MVLCRPICCKGVCGQVAQSHPIIQTLFPNNEAAFQNDNSYIHIPETVQSGLHEHEGNFNIFLGWLAQSLDFKITELPKSVEEEEQIPTPASLEQLDGGLR